MVKFTRTRKRYLRTLLTSSLRATTASRSAHCATTRLNKSLLASRKTAQSIAFLDDLSSSSSDEDNHDADDNDDDDDGTPPKKTDHKGIIVDVDRSDDKDKDGDGDVGGGGNTMGVNETNITPGSVVDCAA